MITGVALNGANESDQGAGLGMVEQLAGAGLGPDELVADTGYGSGENIVACAELGVDLQAPVQDPDAPAKQDRMAEPVQPMVLSEEAAAAPAGSTGSSPLPAEDEPLGLEDFRYDETYSEVQSCPAGQVPVGQVTDKAGQDRVVTVFGGELRFLPLRGALPHPSPSQPIYQPRERGTDLLYRVIEGHLGSFLEEADTAGKNVPAFVRKAFWDYLDCGLLERGFALLRCEDCGRTRTVAHSCQNRCFCPSCLGRRMCQTAAHLVDGVLPSVPVRQWVLSLPIPLRFTHARNPELRKKVLQIFLRVVFR